MTAAMTIDWPVKQRELVYWVADSRPWNALKFRDDDIVICTWSKSGTTWMQQILAQMIFGGDPEIYGPDRSPWIDSRFVTDAVATAEAQTHRRFLKTHLPIDAITYSPWAKYIYIGRDIRDIFWSWYNHWANFTPEILHFINGLPGREGPPVGYPDRDIRAAFRQWLERDGYPCWPIFEHIQGWFDARHLPNLKLLHFADLKTDLPGQMRNLATWLGIEVAEQRWPAILDYCSIEHMRILARRNEILLHIFKQGGDTFIHKGTNGRWRDVLTLEDDAFCDATLARNLSADCGRWLATGRMPQ
jgi:aryl sulfotransferase